MLTAVARRLRYREDSVFDSDDPPVARPQSRTTTTSAVKRRRVVVEHILISLDIPAAVDGPCVCERGTTFATIGRRRLRARWNGFGFRAHRGGGRRAVGTNCRDVEVISHIRL